MDNYTAFNLYEATFWIIIGIVCYFVGRYLPLKYKNISNFIFFVLTLFGISDFVEIKTQGFLDPIIWWLLIWKVSCIIAFVIIIVWYFKLRLRVN